MNANVLAQMLYNLGWRKGFVAGVVVTVSAKVAKDSIKKAKANKAKKLEEQAKEEVKD